MFDIKTPAVLFRTVVTCLEFLQGRILCQLSERGAQHILSIYVLLVHFCKEWFLAGAQKTSCVEAQTQATAGHDANLILFWCLDVKGVLRTVEL